MKSDEIEKLLPAIFQRPRNPGNLLTGLLRVMQDLQAPSEEVLQRVDSYFDPRRTTDKFVPYLAYWADLTRLLDEAPGASELYGSNASIASGLGRLRELIASAAYLSQWRGTNKGLLRFLQVATGFSNFDIRENVDLDGKPRPFHVSIYAPKESDQYRVLLSRIVELEKPAYVTYDLSFEPAGAK